MNKTLLLVSMLCCLSFACFGIGREKPGFYDRALANVETPTVSLKHHAQTASSVLQPSEYTKSGMPSNNYWHPRPKLSPREMHRAGVALAILGSVAMAVGAAFFISASQKHNYMDQYGVYHRANAEGDILLGSLATAGGITSLTFGWILLKRSRR